MSSFGTLFRVTTFGESHCAGVGAVVDGVPPGLRLSEADIQPQLTRRRPGQSRLTTPRAEADAVRILSGCERGWTLGTPVALFVANDNVRPADYAEFAAAGAGGAASAGAAAVTAPSSGGIPRPGHADYAYLVKYGIAASSGGGRSSARESVGRVAAGAIAEKWLREAYGTEIVTFVSAVGPVDLPAHALRNADGAPWTRADVDRLGTLTILRHAARTGWVCLRAARVSGVSGGGAAAPPADEAAAQAALDASDEDAFADAYRRRFPALAGPMAAAPRAGADGAYAAGTPCYEAADGALYDMDGALLPPLPAAALAALRSDEVIALRCPHAPSACAFASQIRAVRADADSTGGVLTTVVSRVPLGLGEPCFDKCEALLAHAMLSLPATKGFEIGDGFAGARLRGSQHNDPFVAVAAAAAPAASASASASGTAAAAAVPPPLLRPASNHAGGTLGGITSGADLLFRVPIKPVSTIGRAQVSATYGGDLATLEAKGRHDACVLPRAPPLVEAMTALVLADLALIQRARLGPAAALAVFPPPADAPAAAAATTAAAGRKRSHAEAAAGSDAALPAR